MLCEQCVFAYALEFSTARRAVAPQPADQGVGEGADCRPILLACISGLAGLIFGGRTAAGWDEESRSALTATDFLTSGFLADLQDCAAL